MLNLKTEHEINATKYREQFFDLQETNFKLIDQIAKLKKEVCEQRGQPRKETSDQSAVIKQLTQDLNESMKVKHQYEEVFIALDAHKKTQKYLHRFIKQFQSKEEEQKVEMEDL